MKGFFPHQRDSEVFYQFPNDDIRFSLISLKEWDVHLTYPNHSPLLAMMHLQVKPRTSKGARTILCFDIRLSRHLFCCRPACYWPEEGDVF